MRPAKLLCPATLCVEGSLRAQSDAATPAHQVGAAEKTKNKEAGQMYLIDASLAMSQRMEEARTPSRLRVTEGEGGKKNNNKKQQNMRSSLATPSPTLNQPQLSSEAKTQEEWEGPTDGRTERVTK